MHADHENHSIAAAIIGGDLRGEAARLAARRIAIAGGRLLGRDCFWRRGELCAHSVSLAEARAHAATFGLAVDNCIGCCHIPAAVAGAAAAVERLASTCVRDRLHAQVWLLETAALADAAAIERELEIEDLQESAAAA